MWWWKNRLSCEEARTIAEKVCHDRSWPLLQPIEITSGLFSWTIVTNARAMGANVRIEVSRRTKEVTTAAYLPR